MILKLRKEFGKLSDYVYTDASYIDIIKRNVPDMKGYLKEDELPSPTSDMIFKLMFTKEETMKYACLVFSSILDVEYQYLVDNMVLYRNELSKIWLDGSRGYGDFVGYCDGVFFSMEMNNTNELERNSDFANRLYAIDAKEDRKKSKEDKRYTTVFQVNINNFVIKEVSKTINISVTTDGEVRRAKIIYVDIYLPHLVKKYKKSGIESLQYAERLVLAMFIARESEAKKLAKGEEEIMEFIRKLKELKRDREAMSYYVKEDSSRKAGIEEGLERGRIAGIEEGREKGREEEKEQTAINMLKDGMSPDIVQKYTKLSPSKIKNIMTLL